MVTVGLVRSADFFDDEDEKPWTLSAHDGAAGVAFPVESSSDFSVNVQSESAELYDIAVLTLAE